MRRRLDGGRMGGAVASIGVWFSSGRKFGRSGSTALQSFGRAPVSLASILNRSGKLFRDLRIFGSGIGRRFVQDLFQGFHHGPAVVRRGAGQHGERERAHGVNIGPGIDAPPVRSLRRHVRGRSQDRPVLGLKRRGGPDVLDQAKVEDARRSIVGQQGIAPLDIPEDKTERMSVLKPPSCRAMSLASGRPSFVRRASRSAGVSSGRYSMTEKITLRSSPIPPPPRCSGVSARWRSWPPSGTGKRTLHRSPSAREGLSLPCGR